MIILSIDVGIKHLAYCLIDVSTNNYNIISWDIINITTTNCCKYCNIEPLCIHNGEFLCSHHIKNLNLKLHNKKITALQNSSACKQKEFLKKKGIVNYGKKGVNTSIKTEFNTYISNNYYKKIKSINANKIDIITLGKNINYHFNKLFNRHIDIVLIENQITKIANRMKTIQGMIAQYFIMKQIKIIEFVSSTKKLKLFVSDKKTTYKERKELSILYTHKLLKKQPTKWCEFFSNNNKKDDLADSLLQGLAYINYSLYLKLNDLVNS